MVGAFVEGPGAGCLGATDRIAERTIKGGGKLGGVGKNAGGGEPDGVERRANHPDPAVHHVGRSDEVGPGAAQNSRLFGQQG